MKNVFIKKLGNFINKNSKQFFAFLVFVVAISIYLITSSLAAVTPLEELVITSENVSYENNVPGSWQVQESVEWQSLNKAKVTLNVDTSLMIDDKDTDVIFVIDVSGSMFAEKMVQLKKDFSALVNQILSNENNSIALITYNTTSTIVSSFTKDSDKLINEINNLQSSGETNYYQALVNVDEILKDYQKEDNKDVVVLFLADGKANVDASNYVAQYQYLKETYPYIFVNCIRYDFGSETNNPLENFGDNHFFASVNDLKDVLVDASVAPVQYDKFKITDYINTEYFKIDDVVADYGEVELEDYDDKQKVTWDISKFKSGRDTKLTMSLSLKDASLEYKDYYILSDKLDVVSSILGVSDEKIQNTDSLALYDTYDVIYDINEPDGCDVSYNVENERFRVFETVSISNENPSCAGYEFKGWEIVNKGITKVGDDRFIMPDEDVTIRGKWSKLSLSKVLDGTVYNVMTLRNIILSSNKLSNDCPSEANHNMYLVDDTEKEEYFCKAKDNYGDTYYFRGASSNNYVSFAGFIWRIMRINGNGSVRLLFEGDIGTVNMETEPNNDNAYVGYLYGNPLQNSYELTHTNVTDSAIKKVMDQWYEENLLGKYDEYIDDMYFYNDRTTTKTISYYDSIVSLPIQYNPESDMGYGFDTGLGYGKNVTYYGTWIRLVDNIEKYYSPDSKGAPNAYPTFYCTSVNDCYTSSSELYGVNVLKYPIASITMDDAVFAGAGYKEQNANDSTYIYNGTRFHLIGFPVYTTKNSAAIPVCNMMGVHSLGNGWITCGSRGNFAVRPVINVKGDLIVTAGNGSKNSPYFLGTYS